MQVPREGARRRVRRRWPLAFVLAWLGGCALTPESADWIRLQNLHFSFLCGAPETECREFALEYERFRVAAEWYVRIRSADAQPRATFIVFRDRVQLRSVVRREDFERWATATSDGLLLIGVVSKRTELETEYLRHSYVRWSLDANRMRGPEWYLSALAEITASVRLEQGSFTIGLPPNRYAMAIATSNLREFGAFPVNALVAGTSLGLSKDSADAAGWLLLHYLSFGNKERAKLVPEYLRKWVHGKGSLDAFHSAFGSDPELIWKAEAIPYASADRFPALRAPTPGAVDEKFDVRAATREEIGQTLGRIRAIADREELAG